jgi:hypothetical protein
MYSSLPLSAHVKTLACYKILVRASRFNKFFGIHMAQDMAKVLTLEFNAGTF